MAVVTERNTVRTTFEMPLELRKRFQDHCKSNGIMMSFVLNTLVEEYLDKQGVKPAKKRTRSSGKTASTAKKRKKSKGS